ncbi:MAG: T9SS type A sorting domain-containing protein [Ignavibacteria bacterium]|jgi:hypothetical protein
MKNLIIALILLLTLSVSKIFAQKCVLRGSGVNSYTKVAAPSIYKDREALSKTSSANFDVDIINSPGVEADEAVMEAINIWSYLLNNFTQTIKIKVTWTDLGSGGILAQAGPTSYEKNFSGLAEADKYYPIALAEAIAQQNLNGSSYDINMEINTNSIDWYYGLDGNTPADKYDLLSISLHEIEHGLGFVDSYNYSDEIGSYNYDKDTTISGDEYPMIYDRLVSSGESPASQLLLDFPNNSQDLGDQLTSNSVYITGYNLVPLNNGNNAKIYAPTTWESGSSISHFDEDTYPAGNSNSLMSPQFDMAEAVHSPGELGLAVMQDIGWEINRLITITYPEAGIYLTMGTTYNMKWTDNYGGNIKIELWKRNLSSYSLDRTIESNFSSSKGANTYSWSVPLDLQEGEYKLKMLDVGSGYGFSETFNIQAQQTVIKTVYFDQRDDDDDLLGRINIWPDNVSAWQDMSSSSYTDLVLNSQVAVRASQTFPGGTTKKFYRMYDENPNNDLSYINHTYYAVRDMDQGEWQWIYLKLNQAENSTINTLVDGVDISSLTVEFKDPWYIDDNSDSKGARNRGINALYYSKSSPFTPSTSSDYKGVFLNQGSPNWVPPYYSLRVPSTQTIDINGRDHTCYFLNWSSNGADFQNANVVETPVVFTASDAVVSANYKGTGLSNNNNAFGNTSQRKFVRTDNGDLHIVYESMGKVWYERSTDNGLTWQIANGEQPLSGSNEGKLPAIDYRDNEVTIVWQEDDSGAYSIKMANYYSGNPSFTPRIVHIDIAVSYDYNTNPLIAKDGEGRLLVVWQNGQDGISYRFGAHSSYSENWFDYGVIPNTSTSSINPTIAANKTSLIPAAYHIAWEETSGSYSYIKYYELYRDGSQKIQTRTTSPETPSDGAGFWTNCKPTIISLDDNTPRLAWVGYTPWYGSRAVSRTKQTSGLWSSTIYNMGSNVETVNMNRTDDGNYVLAWGQFLSSNYTNKYVKNSAMYTIRDFGTTGKDMQICNSADFNNMYSLSLLTNSTPYNFVQSSSVGTLQKSNSSIVSNGRAAVIRKDGYEFICAIGDIALDDEAIDFVDIQEEAPLKTTNELNQYVVTKPVLLNENSKLTLSVVTGVTDSTAAKKLFKENEYIKFSIELIEAESGLVLASFADFEYKANNMEAQNIRTYNLNAKGIGEKEVQIRCSLIENITGDYTLSEFIADEKIFTLGKESYHEVSDEVNLITTEYELFQNYPNPFNPSTIIKYQIPQEGLVSLKIYDILGREVTTLVNEYKSIGQYEVEFNAGRLSGGVYIYKLTAGSYVSSKKMILMK